LFRKAAEVTRHIKFHYNLWACLLTVLILALFTAASL
jgi:hypothetical protein